MARLNWRRDGRALRALVATAALLWSVSVAADPIDRWAAEIADASSRFAIPETWIRRVIKAESGGATLLAGQPIVSRAGAMGLMQLMPGTWQDMRALLGLGSDPHDPADNILAGTAYLRLMYERFGYPGLFAAYNAGPARYSAYLSGRRGLPAETRAYVASVAQIKRRPVDDRRPGPTPIFVVVSTRERTTAASAAALATSSAALFVPLSNAADHYGAMEERVR